MKSACSSRGHLLRWCGWFALGTGLFFALLALRYLEVAPEVGTAPAALFRASMLVTQGSLLALALFVVSGAVALVRPRPRLVVPLAVVLALAALALTLVDTFVYQQYRFHLDASVWRLLTDGGATTTFHMPASTHLAFAGLVLGILAVLIAWAFAAWRLALRTAGGRVGWRVAGALALVLLAHNAWHTWASAASYAPVTQQASLLPLHKPLTARRFLRRLGVEVRQAELEPGDVPSGLRYPRAELRFQPPAARENVVMIVVDSWRYDALSPRATPNLHALSRESVRFHDHHSGGNATRIGMFSLFYGLPGTYWHDVLAERRRCALIDAFQRQGYEIAVFRSAPLYSPEFHETIFAGLEGLRQESDGRSPAECDRDLTEDFLAWLAAREDSRPFFTLLFYDAPHAYDVPPDFPREFEPSWDQVEYLSLDEDTDPAPFKNLYLNSVRWVDHLAGRAVTALRERRLLERSTLVVTSDHGQEFNDLGLAYWGHNSNFARYQSHVPMFLRRPGLTPRDVRYETSHFDVPATLLTDVLGCANPPSDYCVGVHLLDPAARGSMTMAGYSHYAAVLPGERHLVVGRAGGIEVLGPDYRPVDWEASDATLLEESLLDRGRFRPGG